MKYSILTTSVSSDGKFPENFTGGNFSGKFPCDVRASFFTCFLFTIISMFRYIFTALCMFLQYYLCFGKVSVKFPQIFITTAFINLRVDSSYQLAQPNILIPDKNKNTRQYGHKVLSYRVLLYRTLHSPKFYGPACRVARPGPCRASFLTSTRIEPDVVNTESKILQL
jgi:hypothetical protein